jgi:two-component system sensor histidine kinase/response regulator
METLEQEMTIDPAALEEIRELTTDAGPGVFAGLLNTYLADGRRRLDELRAALETRDSPRVQRAAHTLRGSSGGVGARRLAELSRRIEDESRSGRTAGLEALVEAAAEEFGRVREAFEPLSRADGGI